MKLYLLLLPLLFVIAVHAQPITVDTLQNLEAEITEILFDDCVTVSNVVYTGSHQAIGRFSCNLAPELENGIILSTGKVTDAAGPNLVANKGYNFNLFGDSDLSDVLGDEYDTRDAAVLQFDFEMESDSLFAGTFIFGSEEFPEYYGTEFKDLFAIFIRPSDSADYQKVNIAHFPGSNTYIGIETMDPATCPFYVENPEFGQELQWDGFTIPIAYEYPVIPGESYHVKIAIADVSDEIYDSGVLLAAQSVTCETPGIFELSAPTVIVPQAEPIPIQMAEGYFDIVVNNSAVNIAWFSENDFDLSYKIYDMDGRFIFEKDFKVKKKIMGSEIIDLKGLARGFYLIKLNTPTGQVIQRIYRL